ncbi:MAG: chromosome segregation protein SMC [Elusimicrobia bacterium]|nr:chromosome segregation protein SMC [Elusimicrobiota bacterium]
MQLKNLEIFGFKSFADKTTLGFGGGITAIVGPNGCGKTNITDAIKWVLGEQSAKSLRGTKMEDIIFNGTTTRKATSLSEITLMFDNSKNVLPIDYSEVSVTRRLYRSGESEYLLNKVPVRLKDIRNLFLDTGVGTDSYSIMEQGKIDFVLQSKPEERRFLFEEVAGVSKYKSKREEALRKLEKVGQDMLRLNDILVELESQKSKLDTQARKAKQYQKYLDELKNYEVNSLVKKYLEAKNTNAAKQKELEAVNEKQSQVSMEIDKIDAKYSELKLTLASKEDELILKRTEAGKVDSTIQILRERILAAEAGKSDFLKRNEESHAEIKQGKSDLENYKKEQEEVTKNLAEYEKVISSFKETLSKKTEEKNNLEAETLKLTGEIDNVRQEIFNIAKGISDLHNKKSSNAHFLKDIEQRVEKIRVQKEQLLIQKTEKEGIFKGLKEKVAETERLLDAKTKEISEQNARKEQLKQTFDKLQSELFEKKNSSVQLGVQLKTVINSSNYELISKIKEVFGDKIKGTVSDVISVKPEDIPFVQSVLGEKSDYLICDTQNTALEVINWLKNENQGWASFLILSDIEKMNISYPSAFTGKLLTDFIEFKDPKYKKVIEFLLSNATIQDEIIYTPGIVQGGKKEILKKGGIEITNEIEHLKKEILNVNEDVSKSEKVINDLQQEISNLDVTLKSNVDLVETYKNDLFTTTKDLSITDESLKTTNNFLEVLSTEFDDFQKQKAGMEQNTIEVNNLLDEKANVEKAVKERLSKMTEQIQKYQEELRKVSNETTDMTVDFSVKNSQVQHLKEKAEDISNKINFTNFEVEKAEKWLVNSNEKLAEFEKTIKDSSEEINKIVVSKDTMDDVLRKIEKERDDIKTSILDIENELKNLRFQQQKIQDEVRSVERHVSGTSSEIRQIEARVKEEKGIEIQDAINAYQEIAISPEELERLKKRIESLGTVNLAAPEEYEQLEQRYNFLSKQKEDLEKARTDLHDTINKINLMTRQYFQKTFTIVQENFRNIFKQLFEGGEADLILTDEGNLLETGVDIIAQPPGKKLQHISLLSGGERTLTAIAILFALYLVKPAPFCILDEIDGQLDEANVLRFTRMLKEFAKNSQFFVITHNKRTMESANVLYGVTMEELGISKIISVQLEGDREPVLSTVSTNA